MGKATGKKFEEWLAQLLNTWAWMHEDRIKVIGRNDADDGTECEFTVPAKERPDGSSRPERVVPFTIPDSVHDFPNPTGVSEFRRYALLVGAFLAQGGDIQDVTDPFHEDDEEA